MDSMFDEEASSDDETVNSDVRTIRKQLEGLETMYSEVCNKYLLSNRCITLVINHVYRYSNYSEFVNLAVVLDISHQTLGFTGDGCMVVCLRFRHRSAVDRIAKDTEGERMIGKNQSRILK